jgi:hypothetical protein
VTARNDHTQAALATLLAHPDQTIGWLGGVLELIMSGATRLLEWLVAVGWCNAMSEATAGNGDWRSPPPACRESERCWTTGGRP